MKQHSKRLLLFLTLFFCIGISFAQQREITGKIIDMAGTPVANASVLVKGTKNGVATDANGNFSIQVNGNKAVLAISSVNTEPKEVTVGQNAHLDIVLESNAKALGAVVVTALGITQKNRNLGYSVTTVKGEEITQTNTVNPITALQGKVAGVNINVMGAAGVQTSPSIQIRGQVFWETLPDRPTTNLFL